MLVLRALATSAEERTADVVGYTIDDGEKWLAYATSSRTGDTDGAYVRALSIWDVGLALVRRC